MRTILLFFGMVLVVNGWASNVKDVRISGFFSTGIAHSNNDKAITDFGITNRLNYNKLTKGGLGLDFALSPKTHGRLQIIGRGENKDNKMDLDVAHVNHRMSDKFQFRAGRIRPPVWLVSEFSDVHYLYPWNRPPSEIYLIFPINTITGGSLIYQRPVGDFFFEFEIYGGGGAIEFESETRTIRGDLENILGSNIAFHGNHWYARVGYTQGFVHQLFYGIPEFAVKTTNPLDATTTVDTTIKGAEAPAIPVVNLDGAKFYSASFKYEDDFLFWAEYAQVGTEVASFKKLEGLYFTPGYFFCDKSLLLHATFARSNDIDWGGVFGDHESKALGINFYDDSVVYKIGYQRNKASTAGSGSPVTGLFVGDPGKGKEVEVYEMSINYIF